MISYKIPYIICADIESLIKKIVGCANNRENSSATKIGEHIIGVDIQCQQFGHLKETCFILQKRLYEKVW